MHPVVAIFAKEVQDNLRDRRSLLAALIYPLLGPLLFAVLLQLTGDVLPGGGRALSLAVPVVNAHHAPGLVGFLAEKGVRIEPPPEDIEDAVRSGRRDAVVLIARDFDLDVAAGRPAKVTVVNDASRVASDVAASRLGQYLNEYNRLLAKEGLARLGVDPAALEPVQVENVILEARRRVGDLFLYMVPPFLMFTLFIGGVYLAIDATSGERERGSLEPLMSVPVPRWQIMAGKFLAAYLFTGFALLVQLTAFAIGFAVAAPGQFTAGSGLGPATVALFFLIALPLMALTVAVQIIIAAMTRSFKEAQTWLGLLPLIPATPGMVLVFLPVHGQLWMMLLPLFSQTVIMGEVVRGGTVPATHIAISALFTLAAAYGLLRWAAKLFDSEEMVFGG